MAKPRKSPPPKKTRKNNPEVVNATYDSDRSLKLSESLAKMYGGKAQGATAQAAPAPAQPTQHRSPVEAQLETISKHADALNAVRSNIFDVRDKLGNTSPNDPNHLNLINQLQSVWRDYANLTNEFMAITYV